WRLAENAAGGDPDLLENCAADRSAEVLDVGFRHLVATGQHGRQSLAHMTDDQLEPRMAVERAGPNQAQDVEGGFRVPAPTGRLQQVAGVAGKVAVVERAHRLWCQVRMQIERYVKALSGRQDGFEPGVIKKAVLRRAVDERAAEAERLHRAHEFL